MLVEQVTQSHRFGPFEEVHAEALLQTRSRRHHPLGRTSRLTGGGSQGLLPGGAPVRGGARSLLWMKMPNAHWFTENKSKLQGSKTGGHW